MLDRLGVRPSKGLGQHFLFERGIVQRMVRQAGIGPEDHALEIGPGLGILTSELLRRAGRVTAVELDRRLAEHLRQTFGAAPGFRLVEGDALEIATDDLVPPGEPFVVANGKFFGGGMKIVPDAALDDGLLDLAILGDLTRLDLVRNVPRVYRGTHVTHPKFTHLTARSIRVESAAPAQVQLDGELVGTAPVTFTVEPGALRVAG